MKKEHPFLTSSEDCVFAALLALSDKSDGVLIRDIETCYETLKEKFHDRNALQSLSHVLALSGDDMMSAGDKCRNTMSLFDALKERKCKYGKSYELSSLGVLATLDRSINETADDIAEISAFLKGQKGYGFFGYDRAQRLLHAALILTSDVLGGSDTMTGAAIGSTVSMIAAQQAATCAIIVSCAATSVAVSSSAH